MASTAPSLPVEDGSSPRPPLAELPRPAELPLTAEVPLAAEVPRPERRLRIPAYEFAAARRLSRELGIGHVLAQVLARRGYVEPDTARAFLAAEEEHEPAAFEGIAGAVELIHHHLRAGTRIVVHGDYDVDGVCATAIVVRALRALGGNVSWFLPSRIDDGYGLSRATVERLAASGARLLITVDCAITAVEEVALARELGLDVVVSDHHTPRPDGALPEAPIVHPLLCGYPCPDLCGTGVAYKLAQALGAPTADEDLDLVALATVADLVPLMGENRRLVRHGLAALANTAKVGLRALMEVSRCDPAEIGTYALGFRLAPRINAAGRLYRADAGVELLLTEDAGRARQIAAELDHANGERRLVEQRIVWEAERQVAELGPRPAYVLAAEGWHPGVIGIVASRIVERHHRPTLLISLEGEEGTGSGRSIPGFDLLGGLHVVSDLLTRYGGHRAAAGLTLAAAQIPELRARFEEHADAVLTPELLTPIERVDAIGSVSELGLGLAEELRRLEPCGLGNPGPRLLVPGCRFEDVRPMGEDGRHARFSVVSGGARSRGVSFGCDGALPVDAGEPANATFRLERNVWNGAVEPRLLLCHAQPCDAAAIRVIGELGGYLEATLRELDRPLSEPAGVEPHPPRREVVDRRGESPVAVLSDVVATGAPVLAVCADVPRRVNGLSSRCGGFAIAAHHTLDYMPGLLDGFSHVVVLDPPASAQGERLLRCGEGFTHLCWGAAELRFAQQIHELEYGLRASLTALYRSLRQLERVAGEELERLLRGDGAHGRPARLAGRLVRVLAELELVSLDRDLPALALAGSAHTALEHSPAYQVYQARYEDGRQFLARANLLRSA